MSTVQLIRSGEVLLPPAGEAAFVEGRARSRIPNALVVSLLVLALYAAFAHGGVSLASGARIEVALAAISALAAAAWLWTGTLRISAPRAAVAGVLLLLGFGIWSGISLTWSISPDQTWTEVNRDLTYVLVLVLAIAVGSSHQRPSEILGVGYLLISAAVTVYALAQKLIPGLHIAGLVNLNQNVLLPRLQEPLGYWNALALFVVLGVPIALAVAVDRSRSPRQRLIALNLVSLMVLVIALTYSRGGIVALLVALVVSFAASGARLRWLLWLSPALLAVVPSLVFGLTNHALTSGLIALSERELAGAELAVIVVISSAALCFGGWKLLETERRVNLGAERIRQIKRLLAGGAVAAAVVLLVALALSSRGLGGTVSHAWQSFTRSHTSVFQPARLLSADSEDRWIWWQEAAGAFSDRPLLGWGAGSFPSVHLLYRRNPLTVNQPHSVPLQFLAELGLPGALAAIAGLGLLLATAARQMRRRTLGEGRLMSAALFAGVLTYSIHALYDWDWQIPAVTLPALLFLGVLAADRGAKRSSSTTRSATSKLTGIGLIALLAGLFAISAALPSLAASKARAALVEAASTSPGALSSARSDASVASGLDPLSDAGLRAQATIALRQGQRQRARSFIIQALDRDPTDVSAWTQLSFIEALLGARKDSLNTAGRILALDPRGPTAASVLRQHLLVPPPQSSASAIPTPLATAEQITGSQSLSAEAEAVALGASVAGLPPLSQASPRR